MAWMRGWIRRWVDGREARRERGTRAAPHVVERHEQAMHGAAAEAAAAWRRRTQR